MGDRGQIRITDRISPPVFLYSHWGGSDLPEIMRRALARRKRWNDREYLARIVFCEMLREESDPLDGELNLGIGTDQHGDLNNPLIIVDTDTQTVTIDAETWSFDEYSDPPHA